MCDKKKMTVVQVNVLGSSLSTGRTTREMHEYFQAKGINSLIATAQGNDCPDSYAISSRMGIRFDVLFSVLTGLEGYHSWWQTQKFLNYLDHVKPDIVHLRNLHQSYINLGMLLNYLARKDIATVVTLHDFWFLTGKCCYYHFFDCEKWRNGCGNCPAMGADVRKRFRDRTAQMWADKKKWFEAVPRLAVVGNSQWTTNTAKESFLTCAKSIDCIYNWIDFSIFYPRSSADLRKRLRLNGKKIIVGVSAFWNINSHKGLALYIELAKKIPPDYHIVLVGKLTEVYELPVNMTVLPTVSNPNVLAEYYSLADVYLNLSQGETFGKAAAEAVCCGVPLIALNRTANQEIVPPGAGCTIETTSPNEILHALEGIFSKEKSFYLGPCLEHAHGNFNKEENIEKYITIYRKLLVAKQ